MLDLRPLDWRHDALVLIDQRVLPEKEEWLTCRSVADVADAIRTMAIRGAPAIGIAAAYGMAIAAREGKGLEEARKVLAGTRPTGVNLFWALERMGEQARIDPSPAAMLSAARAVHEEDIAGNRRMAELGAARIEAGMGVLTHCNAGALATGGVGTALGVIARAHEQGKRIHVFVDETRPRLQGARLTAWELSKLGVPYTLICDGAAASLMKRGKIQLCVTGADRIAANGDTANKIGTYGVAVAARHHGLPFHVAAPRSTFELSVADGSGIPIEEREQAEVDAWGSGHVFNPAFDVTPAELIRSIFTELGEIAPVDAARIQATLVSTSPRRASFENTRS